MRCLAFSWNVSFVHVPEPLVHTDIPCARQRCDRGAGSVGHFIGWMETGHMPRYIFRDRSYESSDRTQFIIAVVVAGDHQGSDLRPYAQVRIESQRIQHRLQPCSADLPVEILRECLEINICCMQIGSNILERLS